jgi:MerR family transcriptional regulator, global nitrogen regulator
MLRAQKQQNQNDVRRKMIQGQLNAQFGSRKGPSS